MVTRNRIIVLMILVFIFLLAAWSRLRYVEESDYEPQRHRVEDHPAFQKNPAGGG